MVSIGCDTTTLDCLRRIRRRHKHMQVVMLGHRSNIPTIGRESSPPIMVAKARRDTTRAIVGMKITVTTTNVTEARNK